MHGISKMQQALFYVTKRSLNLIKELRAYTWATDKAGATLNKPIDAFNHGIDAMRYYHLGQGKYSGNYVSTTV
jgi:phage terminase large subunit